MIAGELNTGNETVRKNVSKFEHKKLCAKMAPNNPPIFFSRKT
jgi:hypothetical protein